MAHQMECIICYEQLDDIEPLIFANCTHGNCVHADCMRRWNDTCPLCRATINDNIIPINYNINPVNDINYNINLVNDINDNIILQDNIITQTQNLSNIVLNIVNNYMNNIIIHNTNENPLYNYMYTNRRIIVHQITQNILLINGNDNIRNHIHNSLNNIINQYNQVNIYV